MYCGKVNGKCNSITKKDGKEIKVKENTVIKDEKRKRKYYIESGRGRRNRREEAGS